MLRLRGLLEGMVVPRTSRHDGTDPSERTKTWYRREEALYEVPRPTRTPCTRGKAGIAPSWRGGKQPNTRTHLLYACAEGHPCGWVVALSAWGTSVACQRDRKVILAVRSADGNLPSKAGLPPRGGRDVLGRHGEVRGILISILGYSQGRLYTDLDAVVYRSRT